MWLTDMNYARVLSVQDISCLGQCSMTVALPILSACGLETCVLPTMVLSTHTGGLGIPVRRDLTDDIPLVAEHWLQQGMNFDCISVCYLGKARQAHLVAELSEKLLSPRGILVVDPAMADHGKLYSGISPDCVEAMKLLCCRADVILPNLTEACLLAEVAYQDDWTKDQVSSLLALLEEKYGGTIVLTGVSFALDDTGFALRCGGVDRFYQCKRVGKSYHGTGDMFSAVLTGGMMQNMDIFDAAVLAAEFVARAAEATFVNPAHSYGVKFETVLPWLMETLKEKASG